MTTEPDPDAAAPSEAAPQAPAPQPGVDALIVPPEGAPPVPGTRPAAAPDDEAGPDPAAVVELQQVAEPEPEPVAGSQPVAEPRREAAPQPEGERQSAAGPQPDGSQVGALVDLTPDVSAHARVLPFGAGDLVDGTVVKLESDGALVDLGTWREGFLPTRELSVTGNVRPDEILAVGDAVHALVLTASPADPLVRLSTARLDLDEAWKAIETAMAGEGIVTGTVVAAVKGGLRVDIGVDGFVPASLVDVRPVSDLNPYVGQEVTAKIIEADPKRFRVVMSRRAILEEVRKTQRADVMRRIKPGDVVDGVISTVTDIGAFVDIGGADGLVHVSELTWGRQRDPRKVVKPGTAVQVKVLEIDPSRDRISLSLRQTTENPWDAFVRAHSVGEVVTGTVTKNMEFGSFVEVADGVEGLVHVSELAPHRIERPDDVVKAGDAVQVRIIDIDSGRRRLSLSVRAVEEPEGSRRGNGGRGGGRGGGGGGGRGGGRAKRGGGFGRQSFGESSGGGLSAALSDDSLGALEALKATLDENQGASEANADPDAGTADQDTGTTP